jgi:hypothetical protein
MWLCRGQTASRPEALVERRGVDLQGAGKAELRQVDERTGRSQNRRGEWNRGGGAGRAGDAAEVAPRTTRGGLSVEVEQRAESDGGLHESESLERRKDLDGRHRWCAEAGCNGAQGGERDGGLQIDQVVDELVGSVRLSV